MTTALSPRDLAVRTVLTMLTGNESPDAATIRQNVEMVVGMFRGQRPPVELDVEEIARHVESLCDVTVQDATILRDPEEHVPWLEDRTRGGTVQWRFWERYRRYLEDVKRRPPSVVRRLDRDTDLVLDNLGDPQRTGPWDRRGMVVGQVQAGKTSNYTALVCKAADAGYSLIVILAGLHNDLRGQTQQRLDQGVLGFDTRRRMQYDRNNVRTGVGLLPGEFLRVHSLTSGLENGDFSLRAAQGAGVIPGGVEPVVLVVKKNTRILRNLIQWATAVLRRPHPETGRPLVHDVPLLVIDDEADNASVNTNVIEDDFGRPLEQHDPTQTNRLIRDLLRSFDKSSYVGYTATPFANIFIHRDVEHPEVGRDLFPRHFIVSLDPPSNYFGPARVFGITEDGTSDVEAARGLPVVRKVDDHAGWVPDGHDARFAPGDLPGSLRTAMLSFVLNCAARRARGHVGEHNSMLVHATRFVLVQQAIAAQVRDELDSIRNRILYGDGASPDRILDVLQELWHRDYEPTTADFAERFPDRTLAALTWDEVAAHLTDAVEPIEVRLLNGESEDALVYDEHPEGLHVIAIGGDKLSRGLTLEGLSVSYYLRAAKMYDTLLQMGRWFGYRPGYADLCRLYTTRQLRDWYEYIARATEELRREFDYMAALGMKPQEYGLRVRTHPGGLMVTAASKQRAAHEVDLSYGGRISETVIFARKESSVRHNAEAAEAFLGRIAARAAPRAPTGPLLWTDVDGSEIVRFLGEYRTHRESRLARAPLLADYVNSRLRLGELDRWTVALLRGGKGEERPFAGHSIATAIREPNRDLDHRYSIQRLVSPIDETIDLSDEQLREALERTRMEHEKRGLPGQPRIPSGPAIRAVRDRRVGLILLYPLDPTKAGFNRAEMPPIIGLALSFPGTLFPENFMVNTTYWEQLNANEDE